MPPPLLQLSPVMASLWWADSLLKWSQSAKLALEPGSKPLNFLVPQLLAVSFRNTCPCPRRRTFVLDVIIAFNSFLMEERQRCLKFSQFIWVDRVSEVILNVYGVASGEFVGRYVSSPTRGLRVILALFRDCWKSFTAKSELGQMTFDFMQLYKDPTSLARASSRPIATSHYLWQLVSLSRWSRLRLFAFRGNHRYQNACKKIPKLEFNRSVGNSRDCVSLWYFLGMWRGIG